MIAIFESKVPYIDVVRLSQKNIDAFIWVDSRPMTFIQVHAYADETSFFVSDFINKKIEQL